MFGWFGGIEVRLQLLHDAVDLLKIHLRNDFLKEEELEFEQVR